MERLQFYKIKISSRVKTNVLFAQLIRFSRMHSRPSQFRTAAINLIIEMVNSGYTLAPLRSTFLNFQIRYAHIYFSVFGIRLTPPTVGAIWRMALLRLRRAPAQP
jgi:hypothetical protein